MDTLLGGPEGEPHKPLGTRGVFSGCGYGDPRQWRELGGALVLARQLEEQLQPASRLLPGWAKACCRLQLSIFQSYQLLTQNLSTSNKLQLKVPIYEAQRQLQDQ